MPVFQPTIPTGTVDLDQDYLNIQNNFQALDDSFGINHIKFSNTTSNNGKHTYVEMINQSAIPTPLAGFEGTLYTKSDGTQSQLYYTPDNTGNEYQLTSISNADFGTFGQNVNYGSPPSGFTQRGGWTFLPGLSSNNGLVYQYGIYLKTSGGTPSTGTIKFPKPFTNNNYILTTTSGSSSAHYISSNNRTTTGFDFIADSTVGNIMWMAIGIP